MEQDKKDKPVNALNLSTGTIKKIKHGNGNGNWASQTGRIWIVILGPIQKH